MKKLYCYVDESGQDTEGKFFLVSVIITEKEREKLEKELMKIEVSSGKKNVKWSKAKDEAKTNYIKKVLKLDLIKGRLNYSVYRNTKDYLTKTILTTAKAISNYSNDDYKAVILIDGLRKSQTKRFGTELRHLRIRTEKVRGIKKEETNAFMRLADALCGFVRSALLDKSDMAALLGRAKDSGRVKEI